MTDENNKRDLLDVYVPGGGGFRIENGMLCVQGASPIMECASLSGMEKTTAAHLVRRIMAETGLTLLDVGAEPSQLPWGDSPRMCAACSTETAVRSRTVFHGPTEACPKEGGRA